MTTETTTTTTRVAYGYRDGNGAIRSITFGRSDAIRNARLNGASVLVEIACTDRGTVPAMSPQVIAEHHIPRL